MNTSPASNPFTGLKGALAGLMSGGWLGLLLGLLFQRRIARMLAALEGLFAQWKAGTLPLPTAPVRPAARAPAARKQAAAPMESRARRAPASRCRPAVQAAAPRAPVWCRPGTPFARARPRFAPTLGAPRPLRRRARCTENADGRVRLRTPILLRFRN
jgi:hypothetical protein